MDTQEIKNKVAFFQENVNKLSEEIGKFIVGQREVIHGVVTCLLADGQVLLEGVPGLGKTMLVRTLAQAISCPFNRVQFTPDLMPSDIIGTNMMVEDERGNKHFSFQKGPLFTNILLADEINRATPKTQAALLEAMQEKRVTVGTTTHELPPPFFVLATQNPLEMEGTYPLPEAQLDRFLFKINVPFPTKDELAQILLRTTGTRQIEVKPVLNAQTINELRDFARSVPISDHVADYALRLVLGTHPNSEDSTPLVRRYVRFGSGPRGAQSIIITAKITALLAGRFAVSHDDIKACAMPALRHRVILNFEAEAEGISADSIVRDLLQKIPLK